MCCERIFKDDSLSALPLLSLLCVFLIITDQSLSWSICQCTALSCPRVCTLEPYVKYARAGDALAFFLLQAPSTQQDFALIYTAVLGSGGGKLRKERRIEREVLLVCKKR